MVRQFLHARTCRSSNSLSELVQVLTATSHTHAFIYFFFIFFFFSLEDSQCIHTHMWRRAFSGRVLRADIQDTRARGLLWHHLPVSQAALNENQHCVLWLLPLFPLFSFSFVHI